METEKSSHDVVNSFSLQDTISAEHDLWSAHCERLWHQVKNVQEGLENLPPQQIDTSTTTVGKFAAAASSSSSSLNQQQSEEQVYLQLQEYEKRLRAEIAFLQGSDVDDPSSSNKEVQYIILQQDQRKQKQQLKETLSHVRAKHSSIVDSLEQEEDLNSMLKKLQETLKTKNLTLNQDSVNNYSSPKDTFCADLKAKVDKQKDANKYFQLGLKDLLSTFPSPSTLSSKEKRRKVPKNALDNTKDFDEDEFMSLSSIIGKLMEQTLNSPSQPYIDIGDRMWPQHVEFLLRSQVVLKDPDNSARMKLVPFHL